MEKVIKCVAIDDEPLALEVIAKFCVRHGGIDLKTYSDPSEGMSAIESLRPDIVFLDIEMENISGLDIASRLPSGVCVIFTTAYLQYAVEGFNLDAVDYLHKPFAYSRFATAITKAMRRIGESATNTAQRRSIVVKQDYSNVTIPLDDILYIEAIERYSKIYRMSGECTVSRVLLKELMAMLPDEQFLRIHRSFIVPTAKIKSYTRQDVRLTGDVTVPVGRQYAADVMSRLAD